MENSSSIVTCAFREPYVTHSATQYSTIRTELPTLPIIRYINELPYSEGVVRDNVVERFQKSLYGFKPHAIQSAIDAGYKLVVWFDPSVLPTCSIEELFNELKKTDMLVVKGDNHISKMTNDKAFDWFGLPKDIPVNHIGGTFYGFNFNDPKTVEVFNLWKKAEQEGVFGNQDEFMAGHWADESCMALAMFKAGMEQKNSKVLTYKNQKEL